jgi:hypothetical protein
MKRAMPHGALAKLDEHLMANAEFPIVPAELSARWC